MTRAEVRLGDVASAQSGFGFPREHQGVPEGAIPFFKVGDMNHPSNQREMRVADNYIDDATLKELRAKTFPAGTVVFPKIGAAIATGKKRVLTCASTYDNNVMGLVPSSLVDSTFLYYWTLHFDFTTVSNMGPVPSIRKSEIEALPFEMLALSEQRRIVEILDRADTLRQQRQAADEKAGRVVSALFYKMFGDPAKNPLGWPTESLSDEVVDFRYGTSERCEANYDGLPVLRIPNVVRGGLDLTDLKYAGLPEKEAERLRLTRGDVLFVRTNGNRDYVGRCSVFNLDEPFLFASYLIRGRFDQSLLLPEYVTTCLSVPAGRMMLVKGIRTTAGQSNLSVKGLRELVLPRPPIELQSEFREQLRSINQLKQRTQSCGDDIERLFAVLLNRAFSGELTARWRERNNATVEAELEEQLRLLEETKPNQKPAKRASNAQTRRHAGHDMYNKAALTAYIVHRCHDPQQPMGRTKVAKLFHFAHRKAELTLTEEFTRRAAGPLDDASHKFLNLARKNKWVKLPRPIGKLKPVVPGDAIEQGADAARTQFAGRLVSIDTIVDALATKTWQELECWATVDAAAHALLTEGRRLSVDSIKAALAADPDWKPKLRRAAFSDTRIHEAINGLRNLGLLPATASTC